MVVPVGALLMEDGDLSEEQLHRALVRQRERAAGGAPVRLGDLLVEMGFVTRARLDRALARQKDTLRSRAAAKRSAEETSSPG